MHGNVVEPVEGPVAFHGVDDSGEYYVGCDCGRAGSDVQADHGDFGKVGGTVGGDVADKVGTHNQGCVNVFFPEEVYGCEFSGVVAGVAPHEVKPEGVAVEVGGDLVEACDVAVTPERAQGEL